MPAPEILKSSLIIIRDRDQGHTWFTARCTTEPVSSVSTCMCPGASPRDRCCSPCPICEDSYCSFPRIPFGTLAHRLVLLANSRCRPQGYECLLSKQSCTVSMLQISFATDGRCAAAPRARGTAGWISRRARLNLYPFVISQAPFPPTEPVLSRVPRPSRREAMDRTFLALGGSMTGHSWLAHHRDSRVVGRSRAWP